MPIEVVKKFIARCSAGKIGGEDSLGQRVWSRLKDKSCKAWAEAMVAILENSGVKFSTPAPEEQYFTDGQFEEILSSVKSAKGEFEDLFAAPPGQGMGVGKPRQGEGGRDVCECPECGARAQHERGVPCNQTKCPECGAVMGPATDESAEGEPDPNAKVRNRGRCVLPHDHEKVKDNEDHYPINDLGQARNALSRVAQMDHSPPWYEGTLPELQDAVRRAVKEAYPKIQVTMAEDFAVPTTYGELMKLIDHFIARRYPGKEGKVYAADVVLGEQKVVVNSADSGAFLVPFAVGDVGLVFGETEQLPEAQSKEYADELEHVDLLGQPMFMAGAKETPEYSISDLDKMVQAFNELRAELKPPVYLGHTRRMGWPAFGWVEGLHRKGRKLYGDLKHVPKVVANFIKSSGYRRVSPEIKKEYTSEKGKQYRDVFYGLSLLGQDIPRLKLLRDLPIPDFAEVPDDLLVVEFSVADLQAQSETETEEEGGEKDMGDKDKTDNISIPKDEYAELLKLKTRVMELEKGQAKVDEMGETIKTITEERDELQKQLDAKDKDFSEKASKAKTEKINSVVDGFVESGRMTAAEAEQVKAFSETLNDAETKEYGEGDDKYTASQLDLYLRPFQARKKDSAVEYSEQSHKGAGEGEADEAAYEADLKKRVDDYRKENPTVDYTEALDEIWTEADEKRHQDSIS